MQTEAAMFGSFRLFTSLRFTTLLCEIFIIFSSLLSSIKKHTSGCLSNDNNCQNFKIHIDLLYDSFRMGLYCIHVWLPVARNV